MSEMNIVGIVSITDTSVVVHRGTLLSVLPLMRKMADRLDLKFVDARWRRYDRIVMILFTFLFVITGEAWILAFALWSGSDWARSFPRIER